MQLILIKTLLSNHLSYAILFPYFLGSQVYVQTHFKKNQPFCEFLGTNSIWVGGTDARGRKLGMEQSNSTYWITGLIGSQITITKTSIACVTVKIRNIYGMTKNAIQKVISYAIYKIMVIETSTGGLIAILKQDECGKGTFLFFINSKVNVRFYAQ